MLARWLNLCFLILFAGALLFPLLVLFPALGLKQTSEPLWRGYARSLGETVGAKQVENADVGVYAPRWLRFARITLLGVMAASIALLFSQALGEGQLDSVGRILTGTRYGTIWLARALSEDPRVVWVEEDGWVRADTTEMAPPWNLDRIDQPTLPLKSRKTA